MEAYQILLIAGAFAVVATDALLRLRVAPERRDGMVEELLEGFVSAEMLQLKESTTLQSNSVTDALLKHFQQSFGSQHILRALVEAQRGLTLKELEDRLNDITNRTGKASLPSNAVRKVTLILTGAGFVKFTNGRLEMTEPGWALHSMLQSTGQGQIVERSFAGSLVRLS